MTALTFLVRSLRLRNICNVSARAINELSKSKERKISSALSEKKANKTTETLLDYGFTDSQVLRILNSPHFIQSLSKEDLLSNLTTWYAFQNNKKILISLSNHPELLTLTPEYIGHRANNLMCLFTKKDISKLLHTCPKVFLDDLDIVQEKVEYIVHNMGVEQKSIVKSEALQFELSHIKYRHIFMSRVGFYRKINKSTQSNNPPLNKIFSRNMNTFLKLSGLSKEEYEVFGGAYDFEEQLRIEEAQDSDEENENE